MIVIQEVSVRRDKVDAGTYSHSHSLFPDHIAEYWLGSKKNASLKLLVFYIVDGVHWEVVTHVRGCFGRYLLPLVMPGHAGTVQSTR